MNTLRRLARRQGPWSEFALVSLLCIPLLAVVLLQHQLALRASRADEQRLRALLDERVRGFAREVDGAVSQVALRFWVDPEWAAVQADPRAAAVGELAGAWRDWSAAPFAALVREVLVAEFVAGRPRMQRFDPGRQSLEPAEWPEDLRPYQDFLVRQREGRASWHDPAGPGPTTVVAYGLLPAVPAVVLGWASDGRAGSPKPSARGPAGTEHAPAAPLTGCIIVRLDSDFVTRSWLPALVERYLPQDEYDVVVRAGAPGQPLLLSRTARDAEEVIAAPDARAQLLKLEPGELGGFVEHRHLAALPGAATVAGPQPAAPGGSPRRLRALLKSRAVEDPERVTQLVQTLAERGWQLRVRHRAGSLDAAAASIRRRNLLLVYGALLLLLASLGLVVASARAARRLARRQLEFVAGVSHELRTPIAVVRAMATNLADGVVRSDEQVALYGRHLQQHSRRLGDLVERTLEYAGITSGRRRYDTAQVDVAAVVRQALSACDPAERGSRVDVDLAPDLPSVRGDAAALASALRNLVENALRYSPCDRRVTIEVATHERQLAIAVADRGPGIEPADLPHLFEPFYRGRTAVRDGSRGVGLGLALVREIAEAHGGRVEVHSEPGNGSRFSLVLPVGESS